MATKALSCSSATSSIAPSPTMGTYQAPLPFNSNSNSSTTSSCQSPTASSLVLALRQFAKQPHLITDDLNNLIFLYIAATGDLPIVNAKELLDLPKLPEFGQHINKIIERGLFYLLLRGAFELRKSRNFYRNFMDQIIFSNSQ